MTIECPHCGLHHKTTCPRIRRIEYFENGGVKALEFHPPQSPVVDAPGHISYGSLAGAAQSSTSKVVVVGSSGGEGFRGGGGGRRQ